MSRVMLIDDDRNILTSLSIALEEESFEVTCFSDGRLALQDLNEEAPDIIVLDIKMPGMDGFEVLTALRRVSKVPVIFLTSRDQEIDELLGLRMGADDYITKPFSVFLLVERVRTVLRRNTARQDGVSLASQLESSTQREDEKIVKRGDLILDPQRHLCSWKGHELRLTVTEFLLLKELVSRPGYVKSRDRLITAAYGTEIHIDDRAIDSHVKRLRNKFRHFDNDFDRIETLYGIGYSYRVD